MQDDNLAGFFHRFQNGFAIKGQKRPQVDNLGVDSLLLQPVGRVERRVHHRPVSNNRKVAAFATDCRLADRDYVVVRRYFLFDLRIAVQELVLEEQHRIFVANRSLDQALRVVGGRRLDHLQPGCIKEKRLDVLRVERAAVHASAARPTHDHRNAYALTIAAGRGVVSQNVEAARDEIDELHLGYRAHAHHRRAASRADYC